MKKMDGKKTAQQVMDQTIRNITALKEKTGTAPCLCVILIGDHPSSQIYVKNKIKACQKAGIQSQLLRYPAGISKENLKQKIIHLNNDPHVHAVLIQLPLPDHLNPEEILSYLKPVKDADGLTLESKGSLWSGSGLIQPCTPSGIIRLFEHYNIPIKGRHAVVVGRSQIVGLPMAGLLLKNQATVTICHSQTKNLKAHTRQADIVVSACGRHHYLNAEFFKKGAVVVDVGIHRIKKNEKFILEGDVCPDGLDSTVEWFSPVPGGVGPMTIALLLENTYRLAHKQLIKE